MSLLKHGFTKATAPERAVVVTIVAIIYAYRDLFGKIVYVGQTRQTLEARDAQHLRDNKTKFDQAYTKGKFTIEELERRTFEARLTDAQWVAGEGYEECTAWMDKREKALIKQYDTYGINGLNSTKGGQSDTLATKYAQAHRKESLLKFTNEYMPTFHTMKEKGLDVNVPPDKAYKEGSGPAGYEAVFGSYKIPANVKKARSYVDLCNNIRAGHTEVPPSCRPGLLELGFEMDLSLAAWREHIQIFRKMKEEGLDVNVPRDKAYKEKRGPAGYDAVFGSYDIPANVEKARYYAELCNNIRSGNSKVHPDFVQDAVDVGLRMTTRTNKRKR
jgi:hypothetical protein